MKVFIGVDPHKLSATVEVVDDRENVLAKGRFGTDKAGYAAMRRHVAAWRERTWAVEGSNGAGAVGAGRQRVRRGVRGAGPGPGQSA
jgi:transposase